MKHKDEIAENELKSDFPSDTIESESDGEFPDSEHSSESDNDGFNSEDLSFQDASEGLLSSRSKNASSKVMSQSLYG